MIAGTAMYGLSEGALGLWGPCPLSRFARPGHPTAWVKRAAMRHVDYAAYAPLGPKTAVPTLTSVAPSSTAISKSWDMPIER